MWNADKFCPKIFLGVLFMMVLIFSGCSQEIKEADEKVNTVSPVHTAPGPDGITAPSSALPPIEMVNPDDPYLFLPLDHLSFRLTFTEDVDRNTAKAAISFEPALNFSIEDNGRQYAREIYLQPQEKLQADTNYTLLIKNVKNEITGELETIKFTYHTEFYSKKQIGEPQWSHNGQEILYLIPLKTHQNYNYSHSYRYDLFSVSVNGKEPAKLLLGEGQITNLDQCSQSSDYKTLATGHWESFAVGNYFKKEGTKLALYSHEQNSLTPVGLDKGYQKHPAVDPSRKKVAEIIWRNNML